MLERLLSCIDDDLPNSLERLFKLLEIPSVSTDPAYASHCDAAADWLAAHLKDIGFDADKRSTDGHPVVVGHGPGENRRFLFYGHYDVQPVDPLGLWEQDPFKPMLQDTPGGRVIRGRGASDDKGQLMTFVEACRAWKIVFGRLPRSISLLLEGEEECGSVSVAPFLKKNAKEFPAELGLVCDTGLLADAAPAIITRLRGGVNVEVAISAANRDLHSGIYGGLAVNPVRVLAKILADLHDESGRITLEGFYDGVPELPPDVAEQWRRLGFDHGEFLGDVGLSSPAGESGREPIEMIWSRPTCDITGIAGGYQGDGFKTVVAAKASAKVGFRLVGSQNPAKVRESFQAYVLGSLPPDCDAEFISYGENHATEMATDHKAFRLAKEALTEEWGIPAVYAGCGGSIPITSMFKDILGMDSMLIGFGKDDDRIHSPNEKYDLESFHKGIRSWARILYALDS